MYKNYFQHLLQHSKAYDVSPLDNWIKIKFITKAKNKNKIKYKR